MPGTRLTIEDRRRIAAWLADGLGYAEIARRLARPTSTISREVGRNGGPDGYEPDGAHQATLHRAHRSSAAREPDRTDRRQADAFVADFAAMMIETGLPSMPARVLACLLTTDSAAVTAAELVERLEVSPASISKAIAYLEKLEIVQRERHPSTRRERYLVDDEVWYRAWEASTRSITRWADTAEHGADLLGDRTAVGTRLRRAARFYRLLAEDMTTAAQRRRSDLGTSVRSNRISSLRQQD
ncbi:helix-turn-helix domain-containing protein [Amycolatopsis sp. NPDC054798]